MRTILEVFFLCQLVKYITMAHGLEVTWNDSMWGNVIPAWKALVGGGVVLISTVFLYKKMKHWGFAFIAAGVASNMFDRFFYGGVADYFWLADAVINAADMCIVFGLASAIVGVWRANASNRD